MVKAWSCAALVALTACGVGTDGTDDTGTAGDCASTEPLAIEFARFLADGPRADGDPIEIGDPPQGGAGYAPFEVRLRAPAVNGPLTATITVEDADSGALLGDIEQPGTPFCSNVGANQGWWYVGDIHARFWDEELADLDGVEVLVTVEIPYGAEIARATSTGTMTWTLGPNAPHDELPR